MEKNRETKQEKFRKIRDRFRHLEKKSRLKKTTILVPWVSTKNFNARFELSPSSVARFLSDLDSSRGMRVLFLSKNILEYKLSEEILKNYELYYQRIIELSYPIKMKQSASILVAHKIEDVQKNCVLLHLSQNFNIYECK